MQKRLAWFRIDNASGTRPVPITERDAIELEGRRHEFDLFLLLRGTQVVAHRAHERLGVPREPVDRQPSRADAAAILAVVRAEHPVTAQEACAAAAINFNDAQLEQARKHVERGRRGIDFMIEKGCWLSFAQISTGVGQPVRYAFRPGRGASKLGRPEVEVQYCFVYAELVPHAPPLEVPCEPRVEARPEALPEVAATPEPARPPSPRLPVRSPSGHRWVDETWVGVRIVIYDAVLCMATQELVFLLAISSADPLGVHRVRGCKLWAVPPQPLVAESPHPGPRVIVPGVPCQRWPVGGFAVDSSVRMASLAFDLAGAWQAETAHAWQQVGLTLELDDADTFYARVPVATWPG